MKVYVDSFWEEDSSGIVVEVPKDVKVEKILVSGKDSHGAQFIVFGPKETPCRKVINLYKESEENEGGVNVFDVDPEG